MNHLCYKNEALSGSSLLNFKYENKRLYGHQLSYSINVLT